ncbi:siderophore iron transporter [Aspergillus clavatus NRRL 1]|uniref:Siderophore iron transporter n=1 Tax=Aspergillus clavatus (strain ATCC 1007 / CBS 513.65 / DSM 816 / NCTC 3887 / NRRL 1 / QM 1276 / 107) TaxID=344612 RepID=A1CGM9_ASPCL|nr:siderophore iron transporter [Aspergillus clavatus NRRL 1]EAW11109.1 siderophore iron transporter [Aspergillus clavatus NRRL 1]
MTAACTMPIAKILNLWDRTLGLSLMVLIAMIGLVMMAACTNIGTYCAAQVFYYVGFTGLIFSIDVLATDTSSLRNRGMAFAFTASPYMITAFAGAPLSEQFHETNWRWAYGCVVILLPVVASPLIVTRELAKQKALKEHKFEYKQGNRTWTESLKLYFIEFDVIGILFLIAGFSLFLLSFVLARSTPDQWRSAKTISMIVVGGVVIIGFVAYFTSYLQVVFDVSITKAGYINSIFDFISPLWLIRAGFLIRTTGHFKWLLLCAVPLYMLAVGLMIHFRSPGNNIGYIIMCEVFMALGDGTIILVMQVAVMAASKHDGYAAMLALLSLFGNLSGAVGNSISGAIWTNSLPAKLRELLPEEALPDWETTTARWRCS